MSWINFPGFRGGPAAVVHGHGSHEHSVSATDNTNNDGRDINKNLINCAELKKLKSRFYSEVLRKKFFVLYEDSRQSLTHPRDPNEINGEHSDDEDEDYEPARLEYYNSRRNWEIGDRPRRVIQLKDAFAITRKKDTRESMHKYVIAIYLVEDCLGIVFDTEQEMNTWLEMLNSCHMGGRSIDGRLPKPKYEHVYEVDVQSFQPELVTNTFKMIGPYRMVVTADSIKFFAVGSDKPITFLIKAIRKLQIPKAEPNYFKIVIGRSTESGSGTITFKCADKEISYSIRETIYTAMREMQNSTNHNPHRNHRGSSRTSSTSGFNNIRNRTHSWSNVDKRSASAKPIISHSRQRSDIIPESRFRTTSEGNAHFEIKPRSIGTGKSMNSGSSPMSPGSFISSESAGSSNSLDDPDDHAINRLLTPMEDVTPATIFEESSAESCIEINGSSERRRSEITTVNLPPIESRLADSVTSSDDVNYTPIDVIPSSASTTGIMSTVLAASPPGTSTHYTTILAHSMASMTSKETSNSGQDNDYMVMSPTSNTPASDSTGPLNNRPIANNKPSKLASMEAATSLAPKHKPLTGLLDEISSMSSSNVTSPNSQSSYNPLLDENDLAASSDYAVMSPASSGGGTAPRNSNRLNIKHPENDEYVDMSPRGAVPIPTIPNRNDRNIGYSPRTTVAASKTPSSSEESPYLVMSPGEPDKHKFGIRTSSIDSNGARPKTGFSSRNSSRNYLRGQNDSQRSSLCFEDPMDFGISPQDNSGSTLIGPCSDYASLDLTRELARSIESNSNLKPIPVVSRLRLDDESSDDLGREPHEDDIEDDIDPDLDLELTSTAPVTSVTSYTAAPGPPHARAYSVGHRPRGISDSNSSVSTTGSGHARYKSRFIDIPGATTASGTSGTGTGSHSSSISPGGALLVGQSPSMASRIGSWFRNRTMSDVPKPVDASRRRRHRTQSEGEKDEL